jgi:hypothetical protein
VSGISNVDPAGGAGGLITRIVSYVHRSKRPPRQRKAVALDVPAIVATKRSHRPTWKGDGSVLSSIAPPDQDGAAQPSTPGDAEHDRAVTSLPPANDDRKSAIISSLASTDVVEIRSDARCGVVVWAGVAIGPVG